MLNYLKIFSWFLFTFGIVGALAVIAGLASELGPEIVIFGVMLFQSACAALVLYGFKLNKENKCSQSLLLRGGWALIVIYIVIGQLLISYYGIQI